MAIIGTRLLYIIRTQDVGSVPYQAVAMVDAVHTLETKDCPNKHIIQPCLPAEVKITGKGCVHKR